MGKQAKGIHPKKEGNIDVFKPRPKVGWASERIQL
jgi:hypothetical protein